MHRTTRSVLVLAVASLALVGGATAAQAAAFPVNPGPVVDGRPIIGTGQNLPPIEGSTYDVVPYPAEQIEAYYTSDAFPADHAAVADAAWDWVSTRVADKCGDTKAEVIACRVAVVFDVDETLLNAYSYYANANPQFSYDNATWTQYVDECGYAPVPETREVFNKFKALGIHVVLISAGSRDTKQAMIDCLNANGVSGWDRYIMRGDRAPNLTTGQYKAIARASVQRQGYTILASIGDQVSDMSYGHLRHGFLLPNTIYYLG
ncbi:MAG: HAD family acid phosphatase [bacterium]